LRMANEGLFVRGDGIPTRLGVVVVMMATAMLVTNAALFGSMTSALMLLVHLNDARPRRPSR
jgi:hypothetical protein